MNTDRRLGAARAAPGRSGPRIGPATRTSENGSATAEAAVVIPGLVVVSLILVWAVTLGTAQMRCFDAARVAARAVARGESLEDARRAALEAAPAGATVTIVRDGAEIDVVVAVTAGAPGWAPAMPDVQIVGSATAAAEDGPGAAMGGVP